MKRCATHLDSHTEKNARQRVHGTPLKEARPSSVPLYLRNSDFYRSLDIEDDGVFFVPNHLMKESTTVETFQDASDLLHTIRYWGSDASLLPVIQFALRHSSAKIRKEMRAFQEEFPLMSSVLFILDTDITDSVRIEKAMELGIVEMVAYLHDQGIIYSQEAIALAAELGHFDCLLQALRDQHRWSKPINMDGLYAGAVAKGQLACVKLLNSSKHCSFSDAILQSIQQAEQPDQTKWWRRLPTIAAQHGQLACLQLLHQKGCDISHCAVSAAGSGSLACLQFIFQKCFVYGTTRDDADACIAAAAHGHLNCLKYLHEQQNEMVQEVCIEAATCGSLDCLQYYHERGGEWHFLAIHAAALNGHLQCLRYAHTHDCPLLSDEVTAYILNWYRARFDVRIAPHQLLDEVVKRQHWDCVQYLLTTELPRPTMLTTLLARANKDSLVRVAIERGAVVGCAVGVYYAETGNLKYLQLAFEHGCPRSEQIMSAAAGGGHLQCLQYAYMQGCLWTVHVSTVAAGAGHLICLKYAIENGCPAVESILLKVAKKHKLTMQYLVEYFGEST